MKNLLIGLTILLGGCSSVTSVTSESVDESSSGFEQGITIGHAACGDHSSVNPSKEIHLQVQESAEKYLPQFLEAAEIWNLSVVSVEILNDSAPYNPGRMLLSTCLDSRQDIVLGRWDMGGFQISHKSILDSLSEEMRVTIFAHELGHNQGLLDSSDVEGIMNSAAVYGGGREPSESERSMVESYWKGQELCLDSCCDLVWWLRSTTSALPTLRSKVTFSPKMLLTTLSPLPLLRSLLLL